MSQNVVVSVTCITTSLTFLLQMLLTYETPKDERCIIVSCSKALFRHLVNALVLFLKNDYNTLLCDLIL